jgi:hypothetical protein
MGWSSDIYDYDSKGHEASFPSYIFDYQIPPIPEFGSSDHVLGSNVARFLVLGDRDPLSWDVDDANMAPPSLTLVALIHTTCHGACGEFAPNKSAVHCGHRQGDKFAAWYFWALTSPDKDPNIRERCLIYILRDSYATVCA